MARDPKQRRIEWLPGPAAEEALQILLALHHGRSKQEVIDLALIRMAWADRFPAPTLPGRDRMRWVLPAALRLPRVHGAPELRLDIAHGPAAAPSGTAGGALQQAWNIRRNGTEET